MNKSKLFLTFIVCGYVSLSLGSASSSGDSGDYIVSPPDNNPSIGYDDGSTSLVSLMKKLTGQGYTTLSYRRYNYSDKNLYSKSGYIGKQLGYYESNGNFVPPKLKNQDAVDHIINDGTYKINKNAVIQAIGEGKFFKKVLLNRLLVEEFFFGQLIVSAGPFGTKANDLASNSVVLSKISSWQTTLKQIRFVRNGIEAKNNSATFTIGKSPCFSPVDFFVGIIIINNASTVFNTGTTGLKVGDVGFLPIDSSAMMNKWTSVYTSDSTGLPTRQPMKFGEMGGTQHSFNLQVLKESDTIGINLAGTNYIPDTGSSSSSSGKRYFSKTMMQKFFQDVGPWALIVEVVEGKVPEVKGLAKMSFADYGKYLQIDTKNTSTFTLSDIFDAPFNAYKDSYIIAKHKETERTEISSTYSLDNWIAQGLFNGVLETSTYQTLADSKTNKPIDCGNVVLNERRQSPSINSILGYGSGNDFLFLRALRITKALLHMSGISSKLVTTNNAKGKSLFLQALAQPIKNISYKGETVYIGASIDGSSNAYLPILPVLPHQSSKGPVQKITPKKSPKTTVTTSAGTSTSSSKGSTSLTQPGSGANGTTAQTGSTGAYNTTRRRRVRGESSSSSAAINAYKKGYKKGLGSRSNSTTVQTGSTGAHNTTRRRRVRGESSSSSAAINAYKKGYKKGLGSRSNSTTAQTGSTGAHNTTRRRRVRGESSSSSAAINAYKKGYKKGIELSRVNS